MKSNSRRERGAGSADISKTLPASHPVSRLPLPDYRLDSAIVTMESPQVQHQRLQALFIGVRRDFDDVLVDQFRGIKYAKIPARFERAQPVQSFHRAVVDATKYGYVLCGSSGKLFSFSICI